MIFKRHIFAALIARICHCEAKPKQSLFPFKNLSSNGLIGDITGRVWVIIITLFLFLPSSIGCGDNRSNPAGATGPSTTDTTTTDTTTTDITTTDTTTSTDIPVGTDSELALVKQYATQSSDGYFYHWKTWSVVTVWNGANGGSFQQILSEWNGILNGKLTLIATDSESSADIKVYEDNSVDGTARGIPGFTTVEIRMRVNGMNNHQGRIDALRHEIGHAIGFWNHTTDNGLMDSNSGDGSISSTVRTVLNKLYDLPMRGRLI